MTHVINLLKREIKKQNFLLESIKSNKEIANFGMTMNLIDEAELIKRDCETTILFCEKQQSGGVEVTIEVKDYNDYFGNKDKILYDKLKSCASKYILKFKK